MALIINYDDPILQPDGRIYNLVLGTEDDDHIITGNGSLVFAGPGDDVLDLRAEIGGRSSDWYGGNNAVRYYGVNGKDPDNAIPGDVGGDWGPVNVGLDNDGEDTFNIRAAKGTDGRHDRVTGGGQSDNIIVHGNGDADLGAVAVFGMEVRGNFHDNVIFAHDRGFTVADNFRFGDSLVTHEDGHRSGVLYRAILLGESDNRITQDQDVTFYFNDDRRDTFIPGPEFHDIDRNGFADEISDWFHAHDGTTGAVQATDFLL